MSKFNQQASTGMNYGQGNAIMVLAAEKMGLAPALVDDAKKVLSGEAVHVMTHAAIEKEAVTANSHLRAEAALIMKANFLCIEIKREYQIGVSPAQPATDTKSDGDPK